MCLEVQNLFNNKDVILSREDILKVVKYALKEKVVDISFFCEEDGELHYLEEFGYYVTEQEEKQDAVSS